MKTVGKIEEETHLADLNQLENELEAEIEKEVNNDNAPRAQAMVSSQPVSIFSPLSPGGKNSKFATRVKVRSAFFPGQTISVSGKLGGAEPLVPLSYMEKRRKMKPANDTAPLSSSTGKSKFVAKVESGSQFMRKTVGTLLSLGAVPVKFLNELGFFRYVKERQYNSLLRLETSLGQGHECAEQFVRLNPKARKKDDPKPAPTRSP